MFKANDAGRLFRFLAPIVLLAVFSSAAGATDGAVHPEMIVSAQWLAEHLNDPKVVILHVAEKRSEYDAGHIPGARFLALEDFIVGEDAELPPTEKLKAAFEKVGVSDDSRVVIYTTAWYPMAGRAYYTLDYLGHGEMRRCWMAASTNGSWRSGRWPKMSQKSPAEVSRRTSILRSARMMEEVKKISEQPTKSAVLVDSRPDKRYTDGHIAGAMHVYWQETLVDAKNKPVFLPPDKLRELFAARGIAPGQKLVTYCEIGLQASHIISSPNIWAMTRPCLTAPFINGVT